MRSKIKSLDNVVLIVGAVIFFWLLLLPKPDSPWGYPDTVKYASATLKGQTPFSDFAAMVVGFRALYNNTDAYPELGSAFRDLGIEWDVRHGSNHPPTSYLLASPVAFFSWPVASAVWAWLMLCLIVLSFRFYGLSWRISLGLMPLTMLWPPASASLGQVTIVWMFGLATAWRFRGKAFWSGASIGLASLSKYLPGLVLVIFLVKKKWRPALGFLSIWILSLGIVVLLNPLAINRYIQENKNTSVKIMARTDNAAPLIVSYRYAGWFGVALLILFFALIVFVNRRHFYDRQGPASLRAWLLLSYLAVACLPIFWLYSLMPLLPVIIFLLCDRKILAMIIAFLCLLIPSIYIHGGEQSVLPIASVSVIPGLAFILDVLPVRLLQKRWGPKTFDSGKANRGIVPASL